MDAPSALRGDYRNIGPDYAVEQHWDAYSADQHALYRRLFERQSALVPHLACAEYIQALGKLDTGPGIPRFDRVSKQLKRATGWEIVPVPGLVPDEVFFRHLAGKRFPVTVWLRKPEEFDYIVEPDVFHDFFGHVPLLFDPVYADHMCEYGKGGLKALGLGGLKYLARLYWYTIEFGLMKSEDGVRAYGAGLISSGGELGYSVQSDKPARRPFDLMTVMASDYRIDAYQDQYFVIESFGQLLQDTAPDFTPLYAKLREQERAAA
ncbi:MAG TPA: phenylalanine 4-monooxygenase [Burkholderiales bacterium]|jgi:phenylalanine-4-hydroxylase|nr:phenylalanine 4-monooxygenase [Burkholderiales bacterium]